MPPVAAPIQFAVDKRLQFMIGNQGDGIGLRHGYFTTRSRATAPCVMS